MPAEKPIHFLGGESQSGAYLLRIALEKDMALAFGRFQQGQPIHLSQGDYLYLGTARSKTLAARLLRHASRTESKPAHQIRPQLVEAFLAHQLLTAPPAPRPKKLHWHVDYLLDLRVAEIRQVIALRIDARLEKPLGGWLLAQPEMIVFAPGLGASDVPVHTHLLRVKAGPAWWEGLPARLQSRFLDTI
jgi:Uri superfamily endonuclease